MNYLVVADVPCEVLLKDTISEGIAELVDDSIQARFCGVGLPTTIKDANEIITNLSNLVAVQVHSRHTVVVGNLSVAHTPVSVVLDGDVHQTLNLTHGQCSEVYVVDWRDCRSGDLSSISSTLKFAAQLVQHEVGAVVVFQEGAVSSTLKCLGEDGDLLSGESDGDHRGCVNCRHYRHRVRRFGCRLGPLRQLAHERRCSDGSAARKDARHQQSRSRCDCADDLHP